MEKNVVNNVTLQCSLNSRVACVGPNGAGKSTIVKLLTGETEPQDGVVWKHPNLRVAYVAQHAFHHVEQHLEKTPNQVGFYCCCRICWEDIAPLPPQQGTHAVISILSAVKSDQISVHFCHRQCLKVWCKFSKFEPVIMH